MIRIFALIFLLLPLPAALAGQDPEPDPPEEPAAAVAREGVEPDPQVDSGIVEPEAAEADEERGADGEIEPAPATEIAPSDIVNTRGGIVSQEDLASRAAAGVAAPEPPVEASPSGPYRFWPTEERAQQRQVEDYLESLPSAERLADWHERFSSEPHMAGTEGDRRLIEKMAGYLESMGLEVEVHRFHTWLPEPVEARLEIEASPELGGDDQVFGASADLPISLPLQERALDEDPFSDHPDLGPGWSAYSGSGDVRAGVVYANYGTKRDFEQLRELGVDVTGKIVVARFGGNFRGYKAKFAEEAGAAGLVIYTDPADAGYTRGPTFPEGGWANASYIQRGSLKALSYPGDPLTPFVEATEDAQRLSPADLKLPTIPVQPIGWGAAYEILRRMRGGTVPPTWQGGLPLAYRLEGGDALVLRLRVEQDARLVETANVLGFLRGETHPEELVIVGSHHDAWTFGAGDPNSGTILVFEVARAFTAALREGYRPARTVVFANWGAEEFGIIGSTEWVEARRDELLRSGVAYFNLDGAAMGTRFRSASSPSLKGLIAEVAADVPQARDEDRNVLDVWASGEEPPFANLGGGSDHVGFYCHVGLPSAGLSAGGSRGSSYHSNYENLHWYRQVVGDDYAGAIMLSRMLGRLVSRLASAPLLPLDPARYGEDFAQHLEQLVARATELGMETDFGELAELASAYGARAAELHGHLLEELASGQLAGTRLARVNGVLLGLERHWLHNPGVPRRPWFRNLFAATDPDSGYAPWMLPALRWGVERDEPGRLDELRQLYADAFGRLNAALDEIEATLSSADLHPAAGDPAEGPGEQPSDQEPLNEGEATSNEADDDSRPSAEGGEAGAENGDVEGSGAEKEGEAKEENGVGPEPVG